MNCGRLFTAEKIPRLNARERREQLIQILLTSAFLNKNLLRFLCAKSLSTKIRSTIGKTDADALPL